MFCCKLYFCFLFTVYQHIRHLLFSEHNFPRNLLELFQGLSEIIPRCSKVCPRFFRGGRNPHIFEKPRNTLELSRTNLGITPANSSENYARKIMLGKLVRILRGVFFSKKIPRNSMEFLGVTNFSEFLGKLCSESRSEYSEEFFFRKKFRGIPWNFYSRAR